MITRTTALSFRLSAALSLAAVASLGAQRRAIDFSVGRWWTDSGAVSYTAAYFRTLFGPLDYGLGVTHVENVSGAHDRRQTGGEISLGLWRDGAGPYVVAGAGLGMRHGDGDVDVQWSAGGGYAIHPLGFLSLAMEARYRVEDRRARGFWRLDPADQRGVIVLGRVAVGFGRPGRATPTVATTEPDGIRPPSAGEIAVAAGRDGVPVETAQLRTSVVQSALEAMGTPYKWGGTDGNGFDCSGLIQFAYEDNGLLVPRVSRDQARVGMQVERSVASLLPGDILGFSVEGGGVTNVGLYVGDGRFIHSASGGVKLSSLTATDTESRWWQRRWVMVRRIIN